jgi:hypothetical protein
MASADKPPGPESSGGAADIALIHGVSPDGDLRVIRQRESRLEVGVVRPLREGAPISGEVVRLTPRKDFPLLCDVKTELSLPQASQTSDIALPPASRTGPAQVATDRYRENWDQIFASRKPRGLAN